MVAIMMPGAPQAVFREQIEHHRSMMEKLDKYRTAHRKFATEECNLYYGDWTEEDPKTAKVKYCHSACHPEGYAERRRCSPTKCTWFKREAHEFERKRPF